MTRRNEDFDEFCDPENPRIITYDDVVQAANSIRPYIIHTPCIAAHTQRELGIYIHYKLDFLQHSGCFKERGALYALQKLPTDRKKVGVVIAATGNEAVGLCYHTKKMNIATTVVVPVTLPLSKIHKINTLGGKTVLHGTTFAEALKQARVLARERGLTYINIRDHPDALAGFGTVALELLDQAPFADAILVPIGTGALAAAVATVIKQKKPSCLVYGVESENIGLLTKSLDNGEPVCTPQTAVGSLAGNALSVNVIGVNAFANVRPLLDKVFKCLNLQYHRDGVVSGISRSSKSYTSLAIKFRDALVFASPLRIFRNKEATYVSSGHFLLVKEDWIARAMLHLSEREKFVVEGTAACTLAAVLGGLVPELKQKNVICILTGGNIDSLMLNRSLERGLAAEGRLVKFRVGIYNRQGAKSDLMRLIAGGGFNVITHFIDNYWTEGDTYRAEMKIVVESKSLEHSLELKRIIERAYPESATFESEPFNDKRTCPCYVKKSK